MSKPNPEQFAKSVLYSLAGIRADLAIVRNEIYRLLARTEGKPYEEIAARYEKHRDKLLLENYNDALRGIGLPAQGDQPDPQNPNR